MLTTARSLTSKRDLLLAEGDPGHVAGLEGHHGGRLEGGDDLRAVGEPALVGAVGEGGAHLDPHALGVRARGGRRIEHEHQLHHVARPQGLALGGGGDREGVGERLVLGFGVEQAPLSRHDRG